MVRHGVTLAHEAGHAVVAVLVGRRLSGIRLHADSSGVTVSRGRPRGPGMVATLLAGHLGPAALGLGAAALVAAGRPGWVVVGLLGLLAVLLLWVRNLRGVLLVLLLGAGAFALLRLADPAVRDAAAASLAWVLLLGAPRTVVELAAERRRLARAARRRGGGTRRGTSDVDQLAVLTRVPAALWTFLLLVLTTAAAGLAGWWLVVPTVT